MALGMVEFYVNAVCDTAMLTTMRYRIASDARLHKAAACP
jgi:hypothetical protein